jgi:hypothetical protein
MLFFIRMKRSATRRIKNRSKKGGARVRQTARKSTAGKSPRKSLPTENENNGYPSNYRNNGNNKRNENSGTNEKDLRIEELQGKLNAIHDMSKL